MNRQLNSPKEMAKRLVFLTYIASVFVFVIELVIAMARTDWQDLMVWVGAFAISAGLRWVGYCWFDFERLIESFPEGCARDVVPEPVREEVENLVVEFQQPGTDWVRRTEIRHRLIELEESQPEIIEAYAEDLRRVLAA